MTDELRPIDFSALDPARNPARLDALAAAIAADAMAARAHRGAIAELAAFRRPALMAAAIIAIIVIPVLTSVQPATMAAPTTDALGIPTRINALARRAEPPSLAELSAALRAADAGEIHD